MCDATSPHRQSMPWELSWKAQPAANAIAKRHYNCQTPDSEQFVPPGRAVVLLATSRRALWVMSAPIAAYVRHAWAGAWVNSLFRNEAPELHRSSDLIVRACAASRAVLGEPPPLGVVTFVDAARVRAKRDPGRCYARAGFTRLRETTRGGLIVYQLLPADFPAAEEPVGAQRQLGL